MKLFGMFFVIIFSFMIASCNSNDNSTSPQASILKGTWSDSTKINTESLSIKLSIDENNGTISGSGDISYSEESGSTLRAFSFKNSASGTFQNKDVVVNVIFAESKFNFTGKLSNDNSTMSGTAMMIIKNNPPFGDATHTFNMNLKKK